VLSPSPPEPLPSENGATEQVERWRAEECPFTIEYPAGFLERIRERAVDAFHSLPNGGLEIGGILFGRVYPNARVPLRVEFTAERPIECNHAHGPIFVLTDEEKARLAALLDKSRLDPALSAFSVAGFWVSHGRGPLAMTADDRELFRKFLPNPWQVALVLKPESGAATRASFFFRAAGELAPHEARHAFALSAGGGMVKSARPAAGSATAPPREDTPPHAGPKPAIAERIPAPTREPTEAEALTALVTRAQAPRRRAVPLPLAIALMVVAALLGAAATYWLLRA